MNLYEPSECSTSSRRTASQRSERASSFDFPRTTESIVILAALPRQASCCNAAWVWTGRRVNLSTIRCTTVGVPLGAKAIELPVPARRVMIEAEQPLFGERGDELNGEKRIAASFLVRQSGQRVGTARRAAQCIRNEPPQVFAGGRRKTDLLHGRSRLPDSIERAQKRVRGTDLVVPIGPDQQQVPHVRVRHQMLEEVERRCIQPLQIIQEQRERMLLAREHPKEIPEHHLEAVLRVLRRQVRNGRLFSDHELQLGNEVDDELTVRA